MVTERLGNIVKIRSEAHSTGLLKWYFIWARVEVRPSPNYPRGESLGGLVAMGIGVERIPTLIMVCNCPVVKNWKHCTTSAFLFYILLCSKIHKSKNASSGRGQGKQPMFPNTATAVCASSFEMLSAWFLSLSVCRQVNWGVKFPLTKPRPANFPGRFNKASGAEGAAGFATVTAISKLWMEHCADYIDPETDHQGCCSLTFLLAACPGSSIHVKSEM